MNKYCVSRGYSQGSLYSSGKVQCQGGSTYYRQDQYSTTAVCKWKFKDHENVRAEGSFGTTCTGYE
jgi:hypothetical protein